MTNNFNKNQQIKNQNQNQNQNHSNQSQILQKSTNISDSYQSQKDQGHIKKNIDSLKNFVHRTKNEYITRPDSRIKLPTNIQQEDIKQKTLSDLILLDRLDTNCASTMDTYFNNQHSNQSRGIPGSEQINRPEQSLNRLSSISPETKRVKEDAQNVSSQIRINDSENNVQNDNQFNSNRSKSSLNINFDRKIADKNNFSSDKFNLNYNRSESCLNKTESTFKNYKESKNNPKLIKFSKPKSKKELLKNFSNNNKIKDENVDCILENMNKIIENKSTKMQNHSNQIGKYNISNNQSSQASYRNNFNYSLSTKSSLQSDKNIENNRYIKSARRKIGLNKDQSNSLEFDFQKNHISTNNKPESIQNKTPIKVKQTNKSNSNTHLQTINQQNNNDSSNILDKLTFLEDQNQPSNDINKRIHQGVLIGSQEQNRSTSSFKDVKRYCDSIIAEEEDQDQDFASNSNLYSYNKINEFESDHKYINEKEKFQEIEETQTSFDKEDNEIMHIENKSPFESPKNKTARLLFSSVNSNGVLNTSSLNQVSQKPKIVKDISEEDINYKDNYLLNLDKDNISNDRLNILLNTLETKICEEQYLTPKIERKDVDESKTLSQDIDKKDNLNNNQKSNENETNLDNENQNETNLDNENQNETNLDNENQNETNLDNENQNETNLDNENQNETNLDNENQNETNLENFENQNETNLDNENQNETKKEVNINEDKCKNNEKQLIKNPDEDDNLIDKKQYKNDKNISYDKDDNINYNLIHDQYTTLHPQSNNKIFQEKLNPMKKLLTDSKKSSKQSSNSNKQQKSKKINQNKNHYQPSRDKINVELEYEFDSYPRTCSINSVINQMFEPNYFVNSSSDIQSFNRNSSISPDDRNQNNKLKSKSPTRFINNNVRNTFNDLLYKEIEYKGIKQKIIDNTMIKGKVKGSNFIKSNLRVKFLNNLEQFEQVLQIVDTAESASIQIKKPKAEFEILWSDYKLIWQVEKQGSDMLKLDYSSNSIVNKEID